MKDDKRKSLIINFLVRLSLTVLIVMWAVLPFIDSVTGDSVLGEIYSIGIVWTVVIVISFFIMVAFYCRTLQNCLMLIKMENRKAKPQSVWFMFAIPFNFVEDFFIVINIANSLEEEKKTNNALKHVSDFGLVTGIGWSIAQVLSFIPNRVGQIAGFIGMVLVIFHWLHIARINKMLNKNLQMVPADVTDFTKAPV